MLITISPEQIERMRELIEPINLAHFNDDCEPPGYSILMSFCGPYGNFAVGRCGNQTVDLGEFLVHPAQNAWTLADEATERGDE